MTVKRMDNVGIVVEDIDAAIEFFTELGLELEGRAQSKETGQMASLDCATWGVRHIRAETIVNVLHAKSVPTVYHPIVRRCLRARN